MNRLTWHTATILKIIPVAITLWTCTGDSGGPVAPVLSGSGGPPESATLRTESTLTPLVVDGFSRTVADGWGTAEVGGPWRIDSHRLPDFRVNGSEALIVKPDNLPRNAVATEGYGLDVAGRTSFSIDLPPDHRARYYTVQVYARRDDRVTDGDNFYRYRVRIYRDGRMDTRIEKNVNGQFTWLSNDRRVAAEWVPGEKYWIRWESIGTSPSTALRMRVWRDGSPEPTTWDQELTVDEPALDVAGTTGVRVSGPNGKEQVTFPVTFAFDDIEYVTPTVAPPANEPPVAAPGGPYSGTVGTAIQLDGSASTDPDGDTPLTYAWSFGDGATGAGVSPSHVYAAADTYTVTLTVTDTTGLSSAPATTTVAVAAATPENQAPVADAGGPYSGTAGSAIQFDGSGSSDPDGDPLTYAWSFGDGATGTGAAPAHTYTAAGTYTVTLTVTDSAGAGSSPSSTTATVQAPTASSDLVRDRFSRTVSGGWGAAEVGGEWKASSGYPDDFRVNGSEGLIVKSEPGPRNVVATGGYGLDVAGRASFSIDTPPDHPGTYYTIQVYARRNDLVSDGNNYYRYRVRAYGNGEMDVRMEKNVAGVGTWLSDNQPIAAAWTPAQKYWIRWECSGTSPSTRLRMRVWRDGDPEPTGWDLDVTVSEPALDVTGTTGFRVSGPNGTEQVTFPITFSFDDLEYVGIQE